MADHLTRFLDGVSRVLEGLIAVLLMMLIVVNLMAVVFRYGINSPLVWTEETLRYVTIWIAMAGAAAALRRDEHMGVHILSLIGLRRILPLTRALVLLLVAGFSVMLLWYAVPMAIRNLAQVSPAARIPMFWPYLAIVVGAAGLALNAIGGFVLLLLGAPPHAPAEEGVAKAD